MSDNGRIYIRYIYMLILNVADIVFIGEMARVKEKLADNFKINDLESLRSFLSMDVAISKKRMVASQMLQWIFMQFC